MISRIIAFGAIMVLLFNVLADLYFYKFCIVKLTKNRFIRRAHWVVDGLFAAAMLGFFFASTFDLWRVPSDWFVNFLLVYLLVYLPKLAFMLLSWPALLWRRLKGFYWVGAAAGAAIFVVMLYGGTLGLSTLDTERVEVASGSLPASFDGYTVAHISDMHLGNMRNDRLLKKTLKALQEERPDIIVFSGDLVHSRTSEAYRFRGILDEFDLVAPVYTVLGNHDYGQYARWADDGARIRNLDDLRQLYTDIGWTLLDNSHVVLHRGNDSIALAGVENWGEGPFQKFGDLEKAMEGTENIPYKILVTHDPSHWQVKVLGQEDIDLALSGHTHAMQFSVGLFGRRYSPASLLEKYWGGLYTEGDQSIYVNVGMGITLFPFRWGAFPELTIITLRAE